MSGGGRETGAAIALLSGGLDSAVAAAMWQEAGGRIALALCCDYGQRAAAMEREAAQRFCGARGLELRSIELPWLAGLSALAGSALVERARPLPTGTVQQPGDAASAEAVWVPARNCVFVAVAAAHAEVHGASAVLAGFNREEAETFKDNSEPFVRAASAFLQQGARGSIEVASPTLRLDKREIAAAARRLGLRREDLWSCYGSGPEPCGLCESCLRTARAWGSA